MEEVLKAILEYSKFLKTYDPSNVVDGNDEYNTADSLLIKSIESFTKQYNNLDVLYDELVSNDKVYDILEVFQASRKSDSMSRKNKIEIAHLGVYSIIAYTDIIDHIMDVYDENSIKTIQEQSRDILIKNLSDKRYVRKIINYFIKNYSRY